MVRTLKHRIDHLKRLIDLLSHLRTSQDNLARHEDKQDNLRLNHAIDETWEQFRLIRAEVVVLRCKTLQTDWELDVARADNVLNLEVGELGIEPELLNDTSVLARGKLAVVLRLGAGNDHLARGEDQCSGLWITDAHDDSRKALVRLANAKWQRQSLESVCTFGLYSAFLACRAIVLRSKRQSRLTVATMFLDKQDKPH